MTLMSKSYFLQTKLHFNIEMCLWWVDTYDVETLCESPLVTGFTDRRVFCHTSISPFVLEVGKNSTNCYKNKQDICWDIGLVIAILPEHLILF